MGVRIERPYRPWAKEIMEKWNWSSQDRTPNGGGYVNVVPNLGMAMRRNENLRVMVASGYFDLATPFFGAENALSQDGIVHSRVSYTYYEAGHMIFLHEPSRVRLLTDVREFVQEGADQLMHQT
jgi:carboxypeptidase C (cathepsin A)